MLVKRLKIIIYIFLLIALILEIKIVKADDNLLVIDEWINQYNSNETDILYSLQETSDGSYIGVGSTKKNKSNIECYDLFIVKMDKNGKEDWTYQYKTNQYDSLYSVIETKDGSFIAVGVSSKVNNKNNADGIVIKVDKNGKLLFIKYFGSVENDYLFSIVKSYDNNYMIAGYTEGKVNNAKKYGLSDAWFLKIDENAKMISSKQYGINNAKNKIYDLKNTNDGNFIAVGLSNNNAYAIKISQSNELVFEKTYSIGNESCLYLVVETNNNEYIMVGYVSDAIQKNALAIKIDNYANLIHYISYGNEDDDCLFSIIKTNENHYVMVGASDAITVDNNFVAANALIMQLDNNLDLAYVKKYDKYNSVFWSISQNVESKYIIAASIIKNDFRFGNDIWVVVAKNANKYKVMFDSNGGAGTMYHHEVTLEEESILPVNRFIKVGFEFNGWSSSKENALNNIIMHIDNANYTHNVDRDITLYASWVEKEKPIINHYSERDENGHYIINVDDIDNINNHYSDNKQNDSYLLRGHPYINVRDISLLTSIVIGIFSFSSLFLYRRKRISSLREYHND